MFYNDGSGYIRALFREALYDVASGDRAPRYSKPDHPIKQNGEHTNSREKARRMRQRAAIEARKAGARG